MIGYEQAVRLTQASIRPLGSQDVDIADGLDGVLATDLIARVDSPSVDASTRDGYAVRSSDLDQCRTGLPVSLQIKGTIGAGAIHDPVIESGEAMRVLTGGRLPRGADGVVADENAHAAGSVVSVSAPVKKGVNVLGRGSDVTAGDRVLEKKDRLSPGRIGLAAAAGIDRVKIYRRPRVWLGATGDEVVLPGTPLLPGQLYASNVMILANWCRKYAMTANSAWIPDDPRALSAAIDAALGDHDAIITSGGAWKGDRDFMSRVLSELGWEEKYHHVRLRPGKSVGFGLLNHKPVFILPGGPSSNLAAFVALALPGLLTLAGFPDPHLPVRAAVMEMAVKGCKDWTQAIFGRLYTKNGITHFDSRRVSSRLQAICQATGLLIVPEGVSHIARGDTVEAILLT